MKNAAHKPLFIHLCCAGVGIKASETDRQTHTHDRPPNPPPPQILTVQGTSGKQTYSVEKYLLQSQEVRAVARRYKVVSTPFELLEIHTE